VNARDDYPNFAFWAQHGPNGVHSETGHEIVRALDEIDRLRAIVDMLRGEVTRLGVDPDTLGYPPLAA
jgi:hypothetical protein